MPTRSVGGHLERRVVAPAGRVPDLRGEPAELLERTGAGLLAHPVDGGDGVAVRGHEVRDEHVHADLRDRREVLLHVEAADRLPHRPLGQRDAALPAGPQLLRARERGAGEGELRVDERRGEVGGERADHPGRQPVAPRVEPVGGEQAEHAGDEARLADHDGVERADGGVQACGPRVEERAVHAGALDERRPGGGVVGRLHVAGARRRPSACRRSRSRARGRGRPAPPRRRGRRARRSWRGTRRYASRCVAKSSSR